MMKPLALLLALSFPAFATNVVFILADDLGYMDVGFNDPQTFYDTPVLDRLAGESMRFTAGYAASSVCSPTRASIMTGLELCGFDPLPEQHIDGVSFAKLLKDPTAEHSRPPLFWHYPHWGNCGGIPNSAIRDGDWKLIRHYWKKEPELFNLAKDPGELNNLAAKELAKFKELDAKLDALLKDTDALLPFENPRPAKRPLATW